MMTLSRRRFLASLCVASSAAARDAGPDLTFPTNARDRIAITSYPFRAYIQSPSNRGRNPATAPLAKAGPDKAIMDLKEFAGMVAKRFNVYNINPLADHFSSTDSAYLDTFRTEVERAKSHVVDLGLAGKNFYDPNRSERDAAVAYGRKWIDIARHIGSPSVRQHIHARPGVARNVPLAADSLRRLVDYGAERNIIVNLENDSAVSEDPYFLISVIRKVNSPYLRALPDFGNSMQGHDAEYNERAVKAMFGYAYGMCHVKNIITAKGGRVYRVDLGKMFAIARASSYRGYFSMEYDTASGDPFEGTDTLIEETLKYLA
ncbi:MAG: sugar phosphate isomerase/epimerase family protein [Bryobacteraceae bacterium]